MHIPINGVQRLYLTVCTTVKNILFTWLFGNLEQNTDLKYGKILKSQRNLRLLC